ncbi:hypothetical protein ACFQO7_33705 [Catellatospora aurea]|uniref:PH (Pleckstrin Homology) domain-containing protein n=1 Tax=Catellatospora aurea TaxID=1337874 RepID=A0ABW2H650_9ACTN
MAEPASTWHGTADGARTAGLLLIGALALAATAMVLVGAVVPRVGVPTSAYAITVAVLALYAAATLALRTLTSWRVLVRIDAHAVRVRSWPLPLYTRTVPRAAVDAVSTVDAGPAPGDPLWWLLPPQETRHVVRRGPGLRLLLGTGRTLTVSVDGPEQAVAAFGEPGTAAAQR